MTTPEQVLVRKQLQHLEEEAHLQSTLDMLKHENQWMKGFIFRLSEVIKNMGK
jgi:hypothetical protein